jgi:hypothetical protein
VRSRRTATHCGGHEDRQVRCHHFWLQHGEYAIGKVSM